MIIDQTYEHVTNILDYMQWNLQHWSFGSDVTTWQDQTNVKGLDFLSIWKDQTYVKVSNMMVFM